MALEVGRAHLAVAPRWERFTTAALADPLVDGHLGDVSVARQEMDRRVHVGVGVTGDREDRGLEDVAPGVRRAQLGRTVQRKWGRIGKLRSTTDMGLTLAGPRAPIQGPSHPRASPNRPRPIRGGLAGSPTCRIHEGQGAPGRRTPCEPGQTAIIERREGEPTRGPCPGAAVAPPSIVPPGAHPRRHARAPRAPSRRGGAPSRPRRDRAAPRLDRLDPHRRRREEPRHALERRRRAGVRAPRRRRARPSAHAVGHPLGLAARGGGDPAEPRRRAPGAPRRRALHAARRQGRRAEPHREPHRGASGAGAAPDPGKRHHRAPAARDASCARRRSSSRSAGSPPASRTRSTRRSSSSATTCASCRRRFATSGAAATPTATLRGGRGRGPSRDAARARRPAPRSEADLDYLRERDPDARSTRRSTASTRVATHRARA